MIEIYAKHLSKFLDTYGEVPGNVVNEINDRARLEAGLSIDYVPSDDVKKYGQYLTIKNERIIVNKELIRQAQKIVNTAIKKWGGYTSTDRKFKTFSGEVKEGLGHTIILKPKLFVELPNSSLTDETFALIITNDIIKVKNLFYCESVVNFAEEFKKNNLKYRASLQKHILQTEFKDIIISYDVYDEVGRVVTFTVKTFVEDFNKEMMHAVTTHTKGFKLPHEFTIKPLEV